MSPPGVYTNLEQQIHIYLQWTCSLKLIHPYGPMLTETIIKIAKIQNLKFHNSLNIFDRAPLGVYTVWGSESVVYSFENFENEIRNKRPS